ncbi:MAG: pyrroline-5-carboxylate reductase [Fibrobacterota bacterium]
MENLKIGFIGAGNMGNALMRGMIKKGGFKKENILFAEKSGETAELVGKITGAQMVENAEELCDRSSVIVVCVKPQDFSMLSGVLKERTFAGKAVISIMAGIKIERVASLFQGVESTARVMPNTPALIGRGVSGICGSGEALYYAEKIMKCSGKVYLYDDESLMDAVTAVSGSGPAYLYAFIEAWAGAAADAGIPAEQAVEMVVETVFGSVSLLKNTEESPEELRKKVTSPGGTTEKGLEVLVNSGLRSLMKSCVEAARIRSIELSEI